MTLPYLTPLTPAQQAAAGLPETWPCAVADKVRFGEIDMLGHVNNAAYLGWFEKARTSYLEELRLTSYDGHSDPRIVIRSAEIHYMREMLRDETYIVTARCTAFRTSSLTMTQTVWADGTQRTGFSCVLVMLTPDGSAKWPLPEDFKRRLIETDGAKAG